MGDHHKKAFQAREASKVRKQNYSRVKDAYEKGISKIHSDYPDGLSDEELAIEKQKLKERIRKELLSRRAMIFILISFALLVWAALQVIL